MARRHWALSSVFARRPRCACSGSTARCSRPRRVHARKDRAPVVARRPWPLLGHHRALWNAANAADCNSHAARVTGNRTEVGGSPAIAGFRQRRDTADLGGVGYGRLAPFDSWRTCTVLVAAAADTDYGACRPASGSARVMVDGRSMTADRWTAISRPRCQCGDRAEIRRRRRGRVDPHRGRHHHAPPSSAGPSPVPGPPSIVGRRTSR